MLVKRITLYILSFLFGMPRQDKPVIQHQNFLYQKFQALYFT